MPVNFTRSVPRVACNRGIYYMFSPSTPCHASTSIGSRSTVSPFCSALNGETIRQDVAFSKFPSFRQKNGFESLRTTVSSPGPSSLSSLLHILRFYSSCYLDLSKARLSLLVVATSGTGYVIGSGKIIDFAGLCWTCAGTMLVAASANTLNQVLEVNNDSKMRRTNKRPLPSARISLLHALSWACSTGFAGTTILVCKANVLAAILSASNLFLYAFVYTPLKQVHPINTWVGAVVGAVPPLLGWASANGNVSSVNAMVLPAALFFWQIPHFMSLAYLCRNDYISGGFKMLSLNDSSGSRTASVALRNSLYLIPLGFMAFNWKLVSVWFFVESSVLSIAISASAYSFYRERTKKNAKTMFHASLLYLPVFMSGLILHRIPNDKHVARRNLNLDHEMQSGFRIDAAESDKSEYITECGSPLLTPTAPFPYLPAPMLAS